MDGFLNLNKPAGWTSHDCVGKLRRIYNTRQVGHGGTLDPDATGVLPVAIGRATRFLQFLSGGKGYRATFVLGKTSTTDDASGEITEHRVGDIDDAAVRAVLPQFIGDIQQIPPVYSAIRRQGKRLYQLAREGATVESLQLQPRAVHIAAIELIAWRGGEFPEVDVSIDCGTGTYIRAIARDLGQVLGCGGLMSHLQRTRSGPFELESSVTLDALLDCANPEEMLQPIAAAFDGLPDIVLDEPLAHRWCCGQKIPHPQPNNPNLVRVIGDRGFLGLGQLQDGCLRQRRVLASQG